MIKIEKTEVFGWKAAIRGMRNAHNSWDKGDSYDMSDFLFESDFEEAKKEGLINKDCVWNPNCPEQGERIVVGKNDLKLMRSLAKAGTDHSKFARMINVTVDITAPLYVWSEIDTYKVSTVRNSCSFMHKGVSKPFEINDFSVQDERIYYLLNPTEPKKTMDDTLDNKPCENKDLFRDVFIWEKLISHLNKLRELYLETKDETIFFTIRQLLPQGYLIKATWQANYQVLWNIYKARKTHRLPEWRDFCKWIEGLPYFKEIYLEKQE